jgi:hypothetical protein
LPFSATERLVFNRFGAIVEPFATTALFMIAGLASRRSCGAMFSGPPLAAWPSPCSTRR